MAVRMYIMYIHIAMVEMRIAFNIVMRFYRTARVDVKRSGEKST
jgi:NADH:ubiquinone oxidoreductase subunit K